MGDLSYRFYPVGSQLLTNLMRGLGYGHLLIRVKLANFSNLAKIGPCLVFEDLWITTCNFSELPLLSLSIHRNKG